METCYGSVGVLVIGLQFELGGELDSPLIGGGAYHVCDSDRKRKTKHHIGFLFLLLSTWLVFWP